MGRVVEEVRTVFALKNDTTIYIPILKDYDSTICLI